MTFFALIPAAGKSRRMGRPKLSLPLGGKSVLERVVEAARRAGAARVLVVLGPHVADLAELADAEGADILHLPHETPDMRATIEHGLDWLERECRPAADDAWLLLPADHPTVDPSIIRRLVEAAERSASPGVLVPVFQGRRGHPALIRWRLTPAIRALPPGEGLNLLFRSRPAEVTEIAIDRADVLFDMDTPEDYAVLRERFANPS